jgi:hypothetical protein
MGRWQMRSNDVNPLSSPYNQYWLRPQTVYVRVDNATFVMGIFSG